MPSGRIGTGGATLTAAGEVGSRDLAPCVKYPEQLIDNQSMVCCGRHWHPDLDSATRAGGFDGASGYERGVAAATVRKASMRAASASGWVKGSMCAPALRVSACPCCDAAARLSTHRRGEM